MNTAIFKVNYDLLRELFLLPDNVRIIDVSFNQLHNCFDFKIVGPDFPETSASSSLPIVFPSYTYKSVSRFTGWDIYK